jgi:anti-sigma B factor antagonist
VSEWNGAGLRVEHHASDGALVLKVTGELDLASAGELEARVNELRPMSAPLAIDVSGVVFVDSSGLRALTRARRAAIEDTGEPVILVGCSEMLRKLLTVTGLLPAFAGLDG